MSPDTPPPLPGERPGHPTIRKMAGQVLPGVLWGLCGFAGNYFKVELFFGIDFLFGSVFVMLAILQGGLLSGAVAGLLASSCTYLLWTHPWGIVTMTAEALGVAWLTRRTRATLVTCDILFWAAVGAPFVYAFYHLIMGLPHQATLLIALKQALNAVFNALFATLVYAGVAARYGQTTRRIALGEMLFTLLLTLVTVPALFFVTLELRQGHANRLANLAERVAAANRVTRQSVGNWLAEHQRDVQVLARLVDDPVALPADRLQALVETVAQASPTFLRMAVVNAEGVAVAAAPARDGAGVATIGRSYADRPYVETLRQTRRPVVSDVVLARPAPQQPIVTLAVPLLRGEGYRGYCAGVVDLAQLRHLLLGVRGEGSLEVTLLDRAQRVVVSTRPDLAPMEILPRSEAAGAPLEGGETTYWIPTARTGIPFMQRIQQARVRAERPLDPEVGWRVLVEGPVRPLFEELTRQSIRALALLALFLVGAAGVAGVLSRRLVRGLTALQVTTRDLPGKLANPAELRWPTSGIAEVQALAENFQQVADALAAAFQAERDLARTLERRVEERTAALQESEARLRVLLDTVPLGILTLQGGRYIFANATAERLLGYGPGEVVGREVLAVLHPDSHALARERLARLGRGGGNAPAEVFGLRKDGTAFAAEVRSVPVMLGGQPGALALFQDITLRKEMETALRRHAANLEALRAIGAEITRELDATRVLELILARAMDLLATTSGAVFLWDEAGQVLIPRAHVGLGEWYGAVRHPLGEGVVGAVARDRVGRIVNDYPHSPYVVKDLQQRTGVQRALCEPLVYREALIGALIVRDKADGTPFVPADLELLRLFASQAAIAIENARRYASAQRHARELAGILTASRAVQAGLDRDETLRQIVTQADAISGAGVRLFLLDEATQTLRCEVWSAGAPPPDNITLRVGESFSGHVAATRQPLAVPDVRQDPRMQFPDRIARFGLISYLGLPVLSGERLDGVLVFSTPSPRTYPPEEVGALEHFAAHAAIALENARLYTTAQQALAAQQRAQAELVRTEQLRGLGQMAAGIAHDLNNTLATVLGQVEIATHAALPPDAQEALAAIETAASDGAATVRRLQNFARPKGASPLTPCALDAIARETLELTRPRWQAESQRRGVTIAVRCDLPADLPSVLGYPPELREVLTNLIFNAVDAMPHGGILTIQGTAAPDTVTLTVTDTGIGMTPEVQAKIFEPFFTTKGVKGTGLGLAVVYGILERHGGTIAVASAVGQGTSLTLTLQRAPTPAVPAAPAPPAPSRPPARRLLVVDDEASVRRTLARLLKLAGHQPVEASDGPHALEILAETPVDCVITDLGMPEMNGWELARCIRRAHAGLPILLLTGWQDQAPEDPGDRATVDLVLGKPVQVGTLLAAIETATGRGAR